jgi:hypothetical protein
LYIFFFQTLLNSGSKDDRYHFVFNMYDVSHDSTISKQELTTLLNHIPKEALHHPITPSNGGHFPPLPTLSRGNSLVSPSSMDHLPSAAGVGAGGIHPGGVGVHNHDGDSPQSEIDPGAHFPDPDCHPILNESLEIDETLDQYTNQDIVDRAFAECDINHEGRLNYEEFKMWMDKNPSVIEYIESILPYNGMKDEHVHHSKKETLPHLQRIKSRTSMGRSASIQEAAGEIFNHQTGNSRRGSMGSRRFSHSINTGGLGMGGAWGDGAPSPMSPAFAMGGQPLSRNSSFSHAPPLSKESGNQSISHPLGLGGGSRLNHSPSLAESNVDPEEQVRFHLIHAMEMTQNLDLKAAIHHLLEGLPEGIISMERHDSSEVSS